MKQTFKFKQFTVNQDQCAMKIGTDGVLLGAWVSLNKEPNSILDIGSGTGVIALMLAQRSNAETIDAIEIDEDAYEQCVDNFEVSDWADRMFCYHAAFDELLEEIEDKYELIICNPPFYEPPLSVTNGDVAVDSSRKKARFYDALPFDELIHGVSLLLESSGTFATVIPFNEEENFIKMSAQHKLFPKKITRVKGNENAKIKRSLLEFTFHEQEINSNELIIETARHIYTAQYIALTKDFYLKM
ncbi:methyltransferase [Aurantibacter sp.]|uniref:tRNA1(Val) (adenine(37)-N6)-methyltransferase n=1 Tax=Aurantibacter sp. TaxID=2807103 RepID=UPI0032670D86